MEQGEKKIFFKVSVFKQGDVLKKMFQKGYKISFRMYLNLWKFSIIDVENRVYGEVLLSLHFSIASFNMANKEAVSGLYHLGLSCSSPPVTTWSSWRAWNLHTCFSNVLSSISEYANDSFKENSREECEAFLEAFTRSCFVELNVWRWWKKSQNFSPNTWWTQQTTKLPPSKLFSFTVAKSYYIQISLFLSLNAYVSKHFTLMNRTSCILWPTACN